MARRVDKLLNFGKKLVRQIGNRIKKGANTRKGNRLLTYEAEAAGRVDFKGKNSILEKYFWQSTQEAWRFKAETPQDRYRLIEEYYGKSIDEIKIDLLAGTDEKELKAIIDRDYENLVRLGWSDDEIKSMQKLDAEGNLYRLLSELYGIPDLFL